MRVIKLLLGVIRAQFLLLSPVCVLLGAAAAYWSDEPVQPGIFTVIMIAVLSAHVSVNALNEYFDFMSGLDGKTIRTPLSGGSGTLPANPALAPVALSVGIATFAVTTVAGIYLILVAGFGLIPLGILGLVIIATYTHWLNRNALLCLIAPGLGFGPAVVMGTHYALTGWYSWASFLASLVVFFLVNNLLLLNQFPDVDADRSVGRRHFPIIIGRRASSCIFGMFLVLAYSAIVSGVVSGLLPGWSLLGLIPALAAVPLFAGVHSRADDIQKLTPYMGLNVGVVLATPIFLSLGLLIDLA